MNVVPSILLKIEPTFWQALNRIDYVVPFEETLPFELISAIRPDILVKGADYEGKEVVGSDIAKKRGTIGFNL